MIWTKKERETILEVCRSVRKWAIKEGGPYGMCRDSSLEIFHRLKSQGIRIQMRHGVFHCNERPSHNEGHYWCEYKGIPFDVTADQFNPDLVEWGKKKMPAITIGVRNRYLTNRFKPFYA